MTADEADRMRVSQTLWRAVETVGLKPAALLKQVGLPQTLRQNPEALVTTAQYFALFSAMEGASQQPGLSLRLSEGMRRSAHTPAFLASTYAGSYRDSLARLAGLKRLGACEEIVLEEQGDRCAVFRRWPFATGPEPRILAESWALFATELGRRGAGHLVIPIQVDFKLPENTDLELKRYFQCPVRFEAPRNQLLLHTADLERLFPGRSPELLEILTPALQDSLRIDETHETLGERVKTFFKIKLAGEIPELSQVALHLAMSERTLQRRIEEEGTTFRRLLTEARRELGRQLMSDPHKKIPEVAFQLGFQDSSSFYRAFREWEGVTPSQWRKDDVIRRRQLSDATTSPGGGGLVAGPDPHQPSRIGVVVDER